MLSFSNLVSDIMIISLVYKKRYGEKCMKKRKTGMIIVLISAVVYCFILLGGLHKCEHCGEVYFGQIYTQYIDGEKQTMCEECNGIYAEKSIAN